MVLSIMTNKISKGHIKNLGTYLEEKHSKCYDFKVPSERKIAVKSSSYTVKILQPKFSDSTRDIEIEYNLSTTANKYKGMNA